MEQVAIRSQINMQMHTMLQASCDAIAIALQDACKDWIMLRYDRTSNTGRDPCMQHTFFSRATTALIHCRKSQLNCPYLRVKSSGKIAIGKPAPALYTIKCNSGLDTESIKTKETLSNSQHIASKSRYVRLRTLRRNSSTLRDITTAFHEVLPAVQ